MVVGCIARASRAIDAKMRARLLLGLFVAYIAATALHLGWVMVHEPFSFDAWNVAVDTRGEPFSVGRFFEFWAHQYQYANPRIGQELTYLCYKVAWFAPVMTPVAFLAIAGAAVVLGTGRRPRTLRDAALLVFATGGLWFALPSIGAHMFSRAYGANYVYTAAIQLWFLVPLRLGIKPTMPRAVLYGLFGVVAGMANEHTGPALCAFLVVYAFKQRGRMPLAGAIGAVIGFALIFFAPGQSYRYEGAAEKVGLLERLSQRGIVNNFDIVRDLVIAAAPLLLVLAVTLVLDDSDDAARRRRALRWVGAALAVGLAIAMTLFVSPKLGARFWFVPTALLLAAVVGVIDAVIVSPRRLAAFAALGAIASGYAAWRTVPLYRRMKHQSDARLAALEKSTPGTVFVADAFAQYDASWWSLGEDLRDDEKRARVAAYMGLEAVVLRTVDLEAPLGVTDARLVPRCTPECPGLELGRFKGADVDSILSALRAAGADHGDLASIELDVELAGGATNLPAKQIVVGRWTPSAFEGWGGRIVRDGGERRVDLPGDLPHDLAVKVYRVGDRARDLGDDRRFKTWGTGAYWALACRGDECFVVAATR